MVNDKLGVIHPVYADDHLQEIPFKKTTRIQTAGGFEMFWTLHIWIWYLKHSETNTWFIIIFPVKVTIRRYTPFRIHIPNV